MKLLVLVDEVEVVAAGLAGQHLTVHVGVLHQHAGAQDGGGSPHIVRVGAVPLQRVVLVADELCRLCT